MLKKMATKLCFYFFVVLSNLPLLITTTIVQADMVLSDLCLANEK